MGCISTVKDSFQMIVQTTKLNTGVNSGYKYSELAEQAAADLVFGPCCQITEGFNNKYDFVTPSGKKIEVKFTNNSKIFIEEEYYDGTPSGLSVTEADYYLIFCTGIWKGKKIGKAKLIPVTDLLSIAPSCKRKSYPASTKSPGARGFILDRELGQNDKWIGNIRYNNGFDLSSWTYRR